MRAQLLGHHRRARALLVAAERGLPTDEATAKIWASELWVLRGTLVSGPDMSSCALISHRNAHLAYALVEQLYTPHPLLLEWYLHRARTAPLWRRRAAVQDAREFLLSVQYDPTDRYTLGCIELDRHAGKYAHQKVRLFHVGSAFGDAFGQWLLMDATDVDLGPALRPHVALSTGEQALLARAADLSPLEDTWVEEFDQLLGRWLVSLVGVGAA